MLKIKKNYADALTRMGGPGLAEVCAENLASPYPSEQAQGFADLMTSRGWEVEVNAYAGTGSAYITVWLEEEDGEEIVPDTKIRFADHSECYCSEDYSVDPDGLTIARMYGILKNKR